LFDLVDAEDLRRTFAALKADSNTTVIYFSERDCELGCDSYLHIQATEQTFYDDFAAFRRASRTQRSSGPDASQLIAGEPSGGEQ